MKEVSPEVADKILGAHLRNVVNQVQSGKPLSAADITDFERIAATPEGLINIRKISLIRRWINGGRLTDDEQTEIADVVRSVDTPREEAKRGKYRLEQKDYAAIFGTSDRTIKRWVKTGRDAGDLPPLDAPGDMPAWWTKHYKHKLPSVILEAARAAAPVVVSPAQPSGVTSPLIAPPPQPAPPSPLDVGTGFEEMLGRVRGAERAAYLDFTAALAANDEGKLPLARKTWSELSKQLRELERDAHDILSRSGATLTKSAVEKTIAEMHLPIVNGLRSMWRRIKTKMLTTPDALQDRVWQDEVDRLLFRLSDSAFTSHE